MAQIPLAPLHPANRPDPDGVGEGRSPGRRPGRLRRAARWLGASLGIWTGKRAIQRSGSSIGEALAQARTRSGRDPRFQTFENGEFDLNGTASSYGISLLELEGRLAARRRQSALIVYVCAGLAAVTTCLWIEQMLTGSSAAGVVLLTLNALGFGAVCVLAAFYQALVNFQIRSRRTAGWGEFLLTDRGFWPTP